MHLSHLFPLLAILQLLSPASAIYHPPGEEPAEGDPQKPRPTFKGTLHDFIDNNGILHTDNPDEETVIAVGDFHGDLKSTLRVLSMAGIVDDKGNWAAPPHTTLVQTGDVVDRGDDTIALYALLGNLTEQAKEKQGKVIRTLGNHEVMNMAMDWRYVTEGDVETFGSAKSRQLAFSENGWIGSVLRKIPIVAKVGDTIFTHGGVMPKWADLGLDEINDLAFKGLAKKDWRSPVFGSDGPLWYRGYAQDPEGKVCGKLVNALLALKAKRMVMGHTPQLTGKILSRCNHMALIVDVGISSYYGGNCAALKIKGERVTALYCDHEPEDMTPSKKYGRNNAMQWKE
ncbi:hypothetical protein HDU97_001367 [Phlyctochytrium planicorne]|nr:hypothetical protein HDU97_001367 [Phlyctochytrium planicorne]